MTSALPLYTRFINIRRLPPGRTRQALTSVEKALTPEVVDALGRAQADELVGMIQRGYRAVDAFVDLRGERAAQTGARNDGAAAEADDWVDDLLISIHTAVTLAARRGKKRGTALGDVARRILDTILKKKLNLLVNQVYEEELVEAERIHRVLLDKYASHFEALGITALVEELGEALPVYRAALEPEQRVTTEMIRAAGEVMQMALLEVIAFILGRCTGDARAATRDRLLAGVIEQDDRLHEALVARRRAGVNGRSVDVDGDGVYDEGDAAGEPVDAEAPADAAALDAEAAAVDPAPLGDTDPDGEPDPAG